MSSVVKKEKETLCTVDGIDWEIFMASRYLSLKLKSRAHPRESWCGSLTTAEPRSVSKFLDKKKLMIERRRDHVCPPS